MHALLSPAIARQAITRQARSASAVLRHPVETDLGALAEIRRDRLLQSRLMTVLSPTLGDDDVRSWIDRRCTDPNGLFRVVADEHTNMVLGFVQLTDIHHSNRIGWVGIALRRMARGQGLGAQSLRLLHALAAGESNLRKLLLYVRHDNLKAQNLYRALGYRMVGRLERHFADHDGRQHDVLLFEHMLEGGE